MSVDSINSLQLQLQIHLGLDYARYLENMRDWFGQRITKDLFDQKMSTILKHGTLDIHNQMMKLIITYCSPSLPEPETVSYNSNTRRTTTARGMSSSTPFGNVIAEGCQDSPGMMDTGDTSTIVIGGSQDCQDEPEFMTINFVGDDEMTPCETDESEVLETDGTDLEAEDNDLEAEDNDLEAEDNDLEAEDNDLEAEGTDLEAEGTDLEAEDAEAEEENLDLEAVESESESEEELPDEPVDYDWLCTVEMVAPDVEDYNEIPFYPTEERFPSNFLSYLQSIGKPIGKDRSHVKNITHGYDIADRLNEDPELKIHFKAPSKESQPYLSAGASIHGRFLLKSWEYGMEGVEQEASDLVVEAVKQSVRNIVTAVIKQRRAFKMRDKKVCHSIGLPCPNPYLRGSHQVHDDAYCSDSTKMADVMQVPYLLPPIEEKERIAALQSSTMVPKKNCRFPSTRATLADLLDVLGNDVNIIPNDYLRLKMAERGGQNYKGYGGSSAQDDDDDDESRELPVCSY